MQLIKLSATRSTNDYLKELMLQEVVDDGTVVVCDHQTQGKGQQGNTWEVEAGKNLTFSLLKTFSGVRALRSFDINCLVSLALFNVLERLSVPALRVKWPNDIMSGTQKLCGILIENSLKGAHIQHSIIGVGLNVNQTTFSNLPKATSVSLKTGIQYDLSLILTDLVNELNMQLQLLNTLKSTQIRQAYEAVLFRKGVPSSFKSKDGNTFNGIIQGINEVGQLVLEKEDGVHVPFAVKELEYLY